MKVVDDRDDRHRARLPDAEARERELRRYVDTTTTSAMPQRDASASDSRDTANAKPTAATSMNAVSSQRAAAGR